MSNPKAQTPASGTGKSRSSKVSINLRSMSPAMVDKLESLLASTNPMQLLRSLQTAFINEALATNQAMSAEQLDTLALLLHFVTDIEEERFRIPAEAAKN